MRSKAGGGLRGATARRVLWVMLFSLPFTAEKTEFGGELGDSGYAEEPPAPGAFCAASQTTPAGYIVTLFHREWSE